MIDVMIIGGPRDGEILKVVPGTYEITFPIINPVKFYPEAEIGEIGLEPFKTVTLPIQRYYNSPGVSFPIVIWPRGLS